MMDKEQKSKALGVEFVEKCMNPRNIVQQPTVTLLEDSKEMHYMSNLTMFEYLKILYV